MFKYGSDPWGWAYKVILTMRTPFIIYQIYNLGYLEIFEEGVNFGLIFIYSVKSKICVS
jgi:hypothetical protein